MKLRPPWHGNPVPNANRCSAARQTPRRRTWCRPNTVVGPYRLGLVTAPLPAPHVRQFEDALIPSGTAFARLCDGHPRR
jgi:hypothetical protein